MDPGDVRGLLSMKMGVRLDGESLAIEPPLSFSIRNEPPRVRLPLHAIGESPARLVLTPPSEAGAVPDLARGKPGVSA